MLFGAATADVPCAEAGMDVGAAQDSAHVVGPGVDSAGGESAVDHALDPALDV